MILVTTVNEYLVPGEAGMEVKESLRLHLTLAPFFYGGRAISFYPTVTCTNKEL